MISKFTLRSKFAANTHSFGDSFSPFVNKFKRFNNPDINDIQLCRGRGEFSAETDLMFDRHLNRIREIFKHGR